MAIMVTACTASIGIGMPSTGASTMDARGTITDIGMVMATLTTTADMTMVADIAIGAAATRIQPRRIATL